MLIDFYLFISCLEKDYKLKNRNLFIEHLNNVATA